MTKQRSRLFIDSDYEPTPPPESIRRIRTITTHGPNFHRLERCHYAPTLAEMWMCAPIFHILVRVREKGTLKPWPDRNMGGNCSIKLPIVIEQSSRIDDNTFDLAGFAKIGDDRSKYRGDDTDALICINGYSVQNRRGASVIMSRAMYMIMLDARRNDILDID